MIKWFKDMVNSDFQLVGGKAHNLSKMYNYGLKVPNGFAITAKAYDDYLDSNNIRLKITEILGKKISSSEKSATIKALFTRDKLSKIFVCRLQENFKKLGSKRVAVRSSSTVEDLPGMSFAGQYSSYLNVTIEDLIEKVILCWQSLWNERAIEYRDKYEVYNEFSHGVVVQEMIAAKISGVIFTANPISGVRTEILVNSAFGLGEAIVSGKVNPDQYVIEYQTGKVLNKQIAKKEILCRFSKKGIEDVAVDSAVQKKSSLNSDQLNVILGEARKVQEYFGSPQDIEFAIDDQDQFFIVQSREITTLFPIEAFDQDEKLRAYLAASSVLLGMKEAFTPLGAELYGGMFPSIINIMTQRRKPISSDFVKYAGGRIFLDITYLLSSKLVAKQFGKVFSGNDLPLKDTMDRLIEKHGKSFRNQGIKFKFPWGVFKYGLKLMGTLKTAKRVQTTHKYDAVRALGEEFYQEILEDAKHPKSVEEKLKFCDDVFLKVFVLTQKQALYCLEVNNYAKIDKNLKKMFGDRFNLDVLSYSLPECITVELGLELNRLAKFFAENGLEPTADHPKMESFLKKFGHRSTVELDFGYKRWREDPEFLLNQIRTYMIDKMYQKNIQEVFDKAKEAENLTEAIYEAVKAKRGRRRAEKIKQLILDFRRASGMREYPKYNIVQALDVARTVILELGKSFQQKGLLDEAEDIFFLRKADILSGQIKKEIVEKNKEIYRKEMARNSIPRIVLNTGETYYSAQKYDSQSKLLQGISLSAGVYEGRVRVVFNPNTSQLKAGEILVTESTNPAWTPLFMTAKALIMEYGGPLSHGGIVAREYGIPAVVGIPSATELLKDGQMVRVNGEAGTVEILD